MTFWGPSLPPFRKAKTSPVYTTSHHGGDAAACTACPSTGSSVVRFCRTARGLPGRFAIRVAPQRPTTARDSGARGSSACACIASAVMSPGARRSTTARVASGVTSRGAKPVPPVVRITLHGASAPAAAAGLALPLHSRSLASIAGCSSGTTAVRATSSRQRPGCAASYAARRSRIAGPDSSAYCPADARSLTVRIPTRSSAVTPGGKFGGGKFVSETSPGEQHTSECSRRGGCTADTLGRALCGPGWRDEDWTGSGRGAC
mmetsp:Transcript_14118/g.25500  ORF Transcript_14118/g.25500 Transcript_14118/m.25500 type:complete len:261 (-) Transcript_14118:71-853(-)